MRNSGVCFSERGMEKKTVDIIDEENSIVITDDFSTDTFDFFRDKKTFKVSSSINEDVHYNYQTIEYRISSSPIRLEMRTVESSSEPPLEYSIQDGVVLESELKQGKFMLAGTLERLRESVEWRDIPIFGHTEVNLYILAMHPDIISPEEYRRFLRQSVEKLKAGAAKVEAVVKSDKHGLAISTGEYGKGIWYAVADKEGEFDAYWKLSDEKKKESAYGKKLDYVRKLMDSLFTESSPKYIGISEMEWKSEDVIPYLEKLLSNRASATKASAATPQQVNHTNWNITIIVYLVTVFFIILKLTDSVHWNWFAVVSPVIIWEGYGFVVGFLRRLNN